MKTGVKFLARDWSQKENPQSDKLVLCQIKTNILWWVGAVGCTYCLWVSTRKRWAADDFYYCTKTSPRRPCSCRNIQAWVPLDGWGIFQILWKTRPSAPSMLQFHPIILNWIRISDIWMPDQIFFMSLEKFLKGKCSSGPKVFKNRHFGSSGETKIFPKGRFVLLYLAAYLSRLAFLMRITLGLIITVNKIYMLLK